uniref:Retrovirus-related Pol polyprotein from transposon TNT 1-94 n=1 Tax=Tanacetum cinerariifolium TaxID=118510 RepID=A0A6L2NTA5_TANCI|nr:hypothetical protein [Tanacetum cinerariifolium]
MMFLLTRCINLGVLLLISLTEVYLERQLVLTSFISPEHKSFRVCTIRRICGAILLESLTSPEMKETKAYKTYLGFATGATPLKIARKFKKASLSKKDLNLNLVLMDEEPISAKKKTSLRNFYKTHLSGSGTVTKIAPSASKIKPSVTNEGTGVKSGVPNVTEEESSENKTKVDDNAEVDKDEEIDYTTSQLYDHVDIQMNEPVHTDEGLVLKEVVDAEMINVQQGNENLETTLDQVVEDAHVIINTVSKKTEVPVTSSSHSSDLAAKFLNFVDIPTTEAEIVSPMDVPVHHEVSSGQTRTLLTIHVPVITESSSVYTTNIPQSLQSFTPPPLLSTPTPPPKLKLQILNLHYILLEEASNFTPPPPVIQRMVTELLEHAILAKESSQPQSSYEAAASLTEFELKKILIIKMDKKGGDYPFALTKPLPLVNIGNRQKLPIDYFFNSDLKYLQGGILSMTYMTSLTKTKVTQIDLPGIENMAQKIWSPVKFTYNKHALWVTRVEVMRKHGSVVIQRRVKDLQLGVKSYQKKINVTKPETKRPDIKKKDPYTPYQDPQGFIYVDTLRRNRLMRLNELYKFSDGTLTRLRSLLDDITKNVRIKYLPQRR